MCLVSYGINGAKLFSLVKNQTWLDINCKQICGQMPNGVGQPFLVGAYTVAMMFCTTGRVWLMKLAMKSDYKTDSPKFCAMLQQYYFEP